MLTDPMPPAPNRLRRFSQAVLGPHGLSILSGLMLAGYWFGGDGLLLFAGLSVPAALAILSLTAQHHHQRHTDGLTGLPLRAEALTGLERALADAPRQGRATACFVVTIDNYDSLMRDWDQAVTDEVLTRTADRLRTAIRFGDLVARLDGGSFAVVPAVLRHADLETGIQLSARIQNALAEPIAVGATQLHISASVGFALPRQLAEATAAGLLEAAECAAIEAGRQGPGSIRAFNPGERRPRVIPARLTEEVAEALENGQIVPWFQPQVSTDTGRVIGFEALARWQHPVHGMIAPAEFLPAVAAAGRQERLGQVMLYQALTALRDWKKAGFEVPAVAVNFAEEDLRDPGLPDRIRWELDRFDLTPDRLCIEVLESVLVPGEDDMIVRNIAALSKMGVRVDLDDFGTGTASIAAIRRFDVGRIKIDRSFVTRIDLERGQQEMMAAILSMAERLDLPTLAEGVETLGEHAMLAQLGCTAVQGFGIAPPMPFAETLTWMQRQAAKLAEAPTLNLRAV